MGLKLNNSAYRGFYFNNHITSHEGFSKTIVLSLGIHVLFIIVALIISSNQKKRIFVQPTLSVSITVEAPTKKAEQTSPTVKIKKAEPKPVIDSTEKLSDALKRIKDKMNKKRDAIALNSKLEKIKQDKIDEEKRLEEEKKQEAIRTIQAKLKVEELTFKTVSVTAKVPKHSETNRTVSKELFDLKFKEYYLLVGDRVRSQWVYSGDKSEDITTFMEISVAPSGKLLYSRIEKSSGNQSFDQSALNAVKKSSPLPPLPEEINQEALVIGLKFCPDNCK